MSGKHAVAFATKPSARSRRASSQPTPGPGAPPGPGLVRPTASPILKDVGLFIALAAIYFVAGKLGLRLAFVHVSATTVWPPTGIALAAFLLLGLRVWPAIFAGAFFVNLTTAGPRASSVGDGGGDPPAWRGAAALGRWAVGPAQGDLAENEPDRGNAPLDAQ